MRPLARNILGPAPVGPSAGRVRRAPLRLLRCKGDSVKPMKSKQKILIIAGLAVLPGLTACAGGTPAPAAARIAELEVEVATLEERLRASQGQEMGCIEGQRKGRVEESRREAASPTTDGTRMAAAKEGRRAPPDDLPIVRLSPGTAPETPGAAADSRFSGMGPDSDLVRLSPPLDEDEEPISQDTRPVLKGRGQHEAWVYHRPVSSKEAPAQSNP